MAYESLMNKYPMNESLMNKLKGKGIPIKSNKPVDDVKEADYSQTPYNYFDQAIQPWEDDPTLVAVDGPIKGSDADMFKKAGASTWKQPRTASKFKIPLSPAKKPAATSVKKKTPAAVDPKKPTQLSGTPGQAMVIPTDYESSTTKATDENQQKRTASQAQGQEVSAGLLTDISEGKRKAGEVDTAFGTDIERLQQQQALNTAHKENLASRLAEHTSRMDTNQEIEFWNKIVGGLGRALAGGIGLGTGLDVGGQYKEPILTTAEELNKPAAAKYSAGVATDTEKFKVDSDFLGAIEKYKRGEELSLKEKTAVLNAVQRDPNFDITKKGTTQTDVTKREDRIITLPNKPQPKVPGKEKAPKVVTIDAKDYDPLVIEANKQLAILESNIPQSPKNSAEFAKYFSNIIQTRFGKGFVTAQPAKIQAFYDGLISQGKTPTEARNSIISDFKNLLQLNFSPTDNFESAKSRAVVYGLPYHRLVAKESPDIGSADVFKKPEPAKQAPVIAPPAPQVQIQGGNVVQPQTSFPEVAGLPDTATITVTDKSTGKSGQISVKAYKTIKQKALDAGRETTLVIPK